MLLEAFWTSPSLDIKAIIGLIPIHLHLQKLSSRFELRTQALSSNHIIKSLLELRHLNSNNNHYLSLNKLTLKQQLNIKGPIVDANNRLNRVFPFFSLFSTKFSPGDRIIDIFPSCFSFHSTNRKKSRKAYICKLDKLTLQALADSKITVIVSDVSIKNYVATSIAWIHVHNNPHHQDSPLCDQCHFH